MKVHLTQSHIFAGKIYMPGTHEIADGNLSAVLQASEARLHLPPVAPSSSIIVHPAPPSPPAAVTASAAAPQVVPQVKTAAQLEAERQDVLKTAAAAKALVESQNAAAQAEADAKAKAEADAKAKSDAEAKAKAKADADAKAKAEADAKAKK